MALEALPNHEPPRPFIKKAENALQYASARHISREIIQLGCGAITGATFTPDEKAIVAECEDHSLKIYNRSTKKVLTIWEGGNTGSIFGFKATSFNPTNSHFITIHQNNTNNTGLPYIWDYKNGSLVRILKQHDMRVNSAIYSPDGNSILTTAGQTARIFDAKTGSLKWSRKIDHGELVHASYSPDGKKISFVNQGNTSLSKNNNSIFRSNNFNLYNDITLISVLDVFTGKLSTSKIKMNPLNFEGSFQVFFCQNGRTVEIRHRGQEGHYISRWNIDSNLVDSRININEVRFGSSQVKMCNQAGIGYQYRSLTLVKENSSLRVPKGLSTSAPEDIIISGVSSIPSKPIFSKKQIIAGKSPHIYPKYPLKKRSRKNPEKILDSIVSRYIHLGLEKVNIRMNPNGQYLVSYGDEIPWLWDWETGLLIHSLVGHTDKVSSAVYLADGTNILTASSDGNLILWDTQPKGQQVVFNKYTADLRGFSVSPDGKKIVLEKVGYNSEVMESETGKTLFQLKYPAYSAISALYKKHKKRPVSLQVKSFVFDLDFTPNGLQIWGLRDDNIEIWDSSTGEHLRSLLFNDVKYNCS